MTALVTSAPPQEENLSEHGRFKEAPWYGKFHVMIGGIGGIGSWLALTLAKAGHQISIYDMDSVELHNSGGQLYGPNQVGTNKTAAVRTLIQSMVKGSYINGYGKYEGMAGHIMFSCFDNMEARKEMSSSWHDFQLLCQSDGVEAPDGVNVFIDGRMEAETGIIYIVRSPDTYNRYVDELFEDDQVPDLPCSFRSTSHNGMMMAAQMTAVFNNVVTNKREGASFREVPFKISYELPTLGYEIIR